MESDPSCPPTALRPAAAMLLVGQLLYILFTLFHTGGAANDHPAIFTIYAKSTNWTLVHLGQFVGMAILISGFALFGTLQEVNGVALKRAVNAWST